MQKILPIIIVALIIISGGAFYGGMQYAQSKSPGDFPNLSSEERQQRMQDMGTAGMGFRRGNDAGFAAGEIISKDDQSITVELRDGGSKIVFYSDSTEISKFVKGTLEDLEIRQSVVINGKTNQDGSITAESIQLRPEAVE